MHVINWKYEWEFEYRPGWEMTYQWVWGAEGTGFRSIPIGEGEGRGAIIMWAVVRGVLEVLLLGHLLL